MEKINYSNAFNNYYGVVQQTKMPVAVQNVTPAIQSAQNDTFVSQKNTGEFDYAADDGKISFLDKLKNFGKGLISPITTMFSSPKNFIVGLGMMAVGAGLMIATGGAAAPVLVAAGVTMGAVQLGTSAYKAATAKTDAEAEAAWEGMGAGTSAVGLSVAGAKASLKGAGLIDKTTKINPLQATIKCFKAAPSQAGKSFNMLTNGEALANLKSALGMKPKVKNNETAEPKAKAEVEEQPVKAEEPQTPVEEVKPVDKKPVKQKPAVEENPSVDKQTVVEEPKPAKQTPVEEPTASELDFDARVKAAIEKQELELKLQKDAQLQARYETERAEIIKFYEDNKQLIKDALIDEDGQIYSLDDNKLVKVKVDDLYQDYTGDVKRFYHGTTPESAQNIRANGFDLTRRPVHGYHDTFEGAYFALDDAGLEQAYGSGLIKAEFTGKVAQVNTDVLSKIKTNYKNTAKYAELFESNPNLNQALAGERETVFKYFLQDLLKQKGYSGAIGTNYSSTANCQYFVAVDPSKIKIIP